MKKLRMAVAQPYTRLGDVDGNLDQTVELSRTAAAAGCRLILFPETSLYGYSVPPEVLAKATTADGPVAERLLKCAQDNQIALAAGVFERDSDSDEIYISQFIALPSGELVVQRKSGGHEKPGIARPPKERKLFSVDGVSCCVVICIDSVMPGVFEDLVNLGCQVELVPTAGGGAYGCYHLEDWNDREKYEEYETAMSKSCFPGGGAMWHRHALHMVLACANLATGDDGCDYFQQGHSMIIDSDGALLGLIPGSHVQEHFCPKMVWADITPRTPQHLPPDALYPPPGAAASA